MPSSPRDWSPTICDHTAPPSVFLGSNAGMSAGDGRTSERRIRISQRGGGSADATAQEPRLRAEILVHPRGCLQHQRPTSSHFSLNAPRASRCGDGHLADHRRSSLKIPEPPTLRTRPHGNVTIPSQGGNRARYDDGVLAIIARRRSASRSAESFTRSFANMTAQKMKRQRRNTTLRLSSPRRPSCSAL